MKTFLVSICHFSKVNPGREPDFIKVSIIRYQVRSASVVTRSYVECYELPFSVYEEEICTQHPQTMTKLLKNIARDLSNKLRKVNQEIRAYQ